MVKFECQGLNHYLKCLQKDLEVPEGQELASLTVTDPKDKEFEYFVQLITVDKGEYRIIGGRSGENQKLNTCFNFNEEHIDVKSDKEFRSRLVDALCKTMVTNFYDELLDQGNLLENVVKYNLNFDKILYHPKTIFELSALIKNDEVVLGQIDTSQITNMSHVFRGVDRLDLTGIEKWNVSNVSNMTGMFEGCSEISFYDLSEWDVSNVKFMSGMFAYTSVEIDKIPEDNLSLRRPWLCNVGNWDVKNVHELKSVFENSNFDESLKNWKPLLLHDDCDLLSTSDFKSMIKGTNCSLIFPNEKDLFENCFSADLIYHWEAVKDTFERYVPENKQELIEYINDPLISLNQIDTSKITDMSYLFADFKSDKSLKFIKNWNVCNVNNMEGMFKNCNQVLGCDFSKWDVSQVTNMNYMFNGAFPRGSDSDYNLLLDGAKEKIIHGIENWDVSNVIFMKGMFKDFPPVCKIDLSKWDVSKVKDMREMFCEASLYNENLDKDIWECNISRWNTDSLMLINKMFTYSGVNESIKDWKMDLVFDEAKSIYNIDDITKIYAYTPMEILTLSNYEDFPKVLRDVVDLALNKAADLSQVLDDNEPLQLLNARAVKLNEALHDINEKIKRKY